MEQRRVVNTPSGVLTYTLHRKQVKNLNLRVGTDQTIHLSVPMRCSAERADQFICDKSDWLTSVMERQRAEQLPVPPEPDRETCRRLLGAAVGRVYPLTEPLGVAMPVLKLRRMTTQWGNCHWSQGYITLNTALARCPEALQDYVALHELVHFLHHDHGSGFYTVMDRLMPDWRSRRRELRRYSAALERC